MKKHLGSKKKYIIVGIIFIIIIIIALYEYNDYGNDKRYLLSQGFEDSEYSLTKNYTGYDDYCKDSSTMKDGEVICNMYYMKGAAPSFGININFGDDTVMTYLKRKYGVNKEEETTIDIQFGMDPLKVNTLVSCQVDDNFKVIENDSNSAYCYTKEYDEYLESHKEYIDDALEKYNSYYDNFNLAPVFGY